MCANEITIAEVNTIPVRGMDEPGYAGRQSYRL